MKIGKTLNALLSAVIISITALTGCGIKDEQKSNAPDYSKSSKRYTIWSYGATCDDWYQVNGKRYYFEDGTRQTAERTKLYADGGFNTLFIDWTFTYSGISKEDFAKSRTIMSAEKMLF